MKPIEFTFAPVKKILTILLCLGSSAVFGQLTDDTTKLVYGSKSTQIILENDLKNHESRDQHPDTTLYRLEQYTVMDKLQDKYQNLGNNGTALYPIFRQVPIEIGLTSGLNAYDLYVRGPETFQYYNTKSPYLDLYLVFGGAGRSLVDFGFTQNVNENWNIGGDIYKITSDKQIGRLSRQDRNVVSSIYDLFTYYQHPKLAYKALFYFQAVQMNTEETGGIYIEDLATATGADLFQYQDSEIRLNQARAREKRSNYHLYHEFNWTKPLQFYHQLDVKTQKLTYKDFKDNTVQGYNPYSDFYTDFLIDPDSTYEEFSWNEIRNEVGVKGDLANLFYRFYIKRRDIDAKYLYLDPISKFSENFVGGITRFNWKDKFNVVASAELLQSGEYSVRGSLNSDFIFGSYQSTRSKPGLINSNYFSNHHEWSQSLASSFTNEIKAGLQYKNKNLLVRPQGRLMSLDKFIYFDENISPVQSNDLAVISSIGGDFNLTLFTNKTLGKAFHLENEVYATRVSGDGQDNIRVPTVFYNGRWFWRGAWFKNTMNIEIGVDLHAKTGYNAMAYAPEIQQFYLQDDFQIDAYYTADFFLNFRINNLRAFAKVVNINQQNNAGYFISPYYPGQPLTFDLGIRWQFYD